MRRARLEWLDQSSRSALGKNRQVKERPGRSSHGRAANAAAVVPLAKNIPQQCLGLFGVWVYIWGVGLHEWTFLLPLPLLPNGPPS